MPSAEPTPSVDPTRSEIRTIHLYRPQNQLGDLLLNVPAIRSIRERFSRAHVVLIVGRQNAGAVLGQRWADEIRVVDTRNFFGVARAGIGGSLGPRPDLAVYFTTVSYSRSVAMLVRWSRARERVGFDPAWHREHDCAGLTRSVAYPGSAPEGLPDRGSAPRGPSAALHQSEVSLLLAHAVGAGAKPDPPYYVADPEHLARAPEGAVYIHPGAGKHKNRWAAERFAAVAHELTRRGLSVWWLEGPQDSGTVEAVSAALRMKLPVVRMEPIPMLAARFARAGLYIGNDTGPLHLAGATGCPTIGIYGWTDPAEWRPVGRCVRSVRAEDGKLESVEPRQVLEVALPLLTEERCAVG
ncbi:MAG TPA: glycosyltransferase family 9 protein [Candidatus Eisenbacteria bacterium]